MRPAGGQYKEYAHRDRIVFEMGFSDYQAYLRSPFWKRKRARALKRDKGKCFICRAKATEVHHKFYSKRALAGQSIRFLFAICRECHQAIEFEGGRKIWPRRARELVKVRKRTLRGSAQPRNNRQDEQIPR